MKKRQVLILSILISTLYLIYSVSEYCGYVRLFHMKRDSIDKYIPQYKDLNKNKARIILSFSTTPEKIKKITPMINSILDQTVKVDQFFLNIPSSFVKMVPENYSKILSIVTTEKDYGEGEKYIPTLLRECDCDTKIIVLEDNVIYGKTFIETLVEESDKFPDKAISANDAILIKPGFFDSKILSRNKNVKFDNDWLFSNINTQIEKIKYSENFKYI
jgi:hypothetical protein